MPNHDDSKLITFRNAFITGLVLLAPLVVTVWALRKIIEVVGGSVSPVFIYFLPEFLRDRPSLGLLWDVIATVIVLLLVIQFGRGKISSLMGEVGKGITAFKKGVDDGKKEIEEGMADAARDVTPEDEKDKA